MNERKRGRNDATRFSGSIHPFNFRKEAVKGGGRGALREGGRVSGEGDAKKMGANNTMMEKRSW